MPIEPVTHLERTIAGTVEPVTHLEQVISEYGGGGGGGGSVTPASIVAATEQMNPDQQSQTRDNLGAISMGEVKFAIADAVARTIVPMTVNSGNLVLNLERWGGIEGFADAYAAGLNVIFALPMPYLDQTAVNDDVLAMQPMGIDQDSGVFHFEGVRSGKRYYARVAPISENVLSGPLVIRDELPPVTAADNVKQALLNCFNHVAAWTDEHGQDYVDALQAALYQLDRITAVYTQSGTVYDTDSLDSLKADLVVTAFYQSGTSKTVTDYTLSGALTEGTSTITVSYGGKTATFNVTVTKNQYLYTLTNSDFMIASLFNGSGAANEYPYYDETATARYSYVGFDLLLSGGKTYKVVAECNYATAQIACQFLNEAALNLARAGQPFASAANMYDSGWKSLTTEVTPPESVNGSNVALVRITIRQSSSNPDISNNFAVKRLTIEEVTE